MLLVPILPPPCRLPHGRNSRAIRGYNCSYDSASYAIMTAILFLLPYLKALDYIRRWGVTSSSVGQESGGTSLKMQLLTPRAGLEAEASSRAVGEGEISVG